MTGDFGHGCTKPRRGFSPRRGFDLTISSTHRMAKLPNRALSVLLVLKGEAERDYNNVHCRLRVKPARPRRLEAHFGNHILHRIREHRTRSFQHRKAGHDWTSFGVHVELDGDVAVSARQLARHHGLRLRSN